MATHEELVQSAPPVEQVGTCDVFLGITGFVEPEALREAADTLSQGLGGSAEPLQITLAYAGLEGEPARTAGVRLLPYAPPAEEGAATPWAVAAASQRTLLALAAQGQARVCVLLNPDLQTVTQSSIAALALPVLTRQAELVLPVYRQGRYDSLLNSSILAPLTRALYGKRVRFPLASDYAVSSRLVARLLQSSAGPAHAAAGSILWPATVAATIDAPVAEAALPAQHAQRTEGLELSAVIAQLVGSVFAEIEHNAPLWQRVRGSQSPVLAGAVSALPVAPRPDPHPDAKPMIDSFLLGWRSLQDLWGLVLPPVTLLELKRLTLVAPENFRIHDELWVRIIYDFALAFRLRTISRNHLLGALTPLYLGWVASYVREAEGAGAALSPERRHEQLAKAFEDGKPYLVRRWRWPDRFNP